MTLALLVAAARAQDDAAALLHEAMLGEALDGDLDDAIRTYRDLARNLAVEDPARTEALYRLGLALEELGKVEEARQALQEGIRSGACAPCRVALEELEIEQHAVSVLPTVWTFDDASHGVFHPIDAQSLGTIRLERAPGDRAALEWRIDGRPGSEDHLVIGLAAGAHQLRLVAMSQDGPGLLGLRAEDDRNRRYTLEDPMSFPADQWREVVVDLSTVVPQEPDEPRPDPSRLVRLEILDRTGLRRGGAVTWWIDTVEVR